MHTIIIGGGMAGLAAATTLMHNGHTFQLIEQDIKLGGRVQTSHVDGHLIDHGFQVYLPGYEEGKHFFDYNTLQLKHFAPGAMVLYDQGYYDAIGDPLRRPFTVFNTLLSKVGSFADKQRLLKLKNKSIEYINEPFSVDTSMSTYDFLVKFGFKQEMIHNFFIPFFSGVFFEQKLETSSAMFLYLYHKFATSLASIPALGMGQLSEQLAAALPDSNIHLGEPVISINQKSVQVASGKIYIGDNIILTANSEKLTPKMAAVPDTKFNASHTIYFEADEAPYRRKLIGIVARKNAIVNNVAIMSNVSKAYAPSGKHQIAVSIFGTEFNKDIETRIKKECSAWFGNQTSQWRVIQQQLIKKALPKQMKVRFKFSREECQIGERLFCAGDFMLNSSINGALKSGRLAAEYAMQS